MFSNNHFTLCQITSQCLQTTIPINNLTMFSISNNKFTLSSSLTQTTTSQYLKTPPTSTPNCFLTPLSQNNFTKSSNASFKQHIHCVQTHIKKQIIMVKKQLHNDFRFCLLTKISWSLFKNQNAFKLSHSYNNVMSSYSPSNNNFTNPLETTTL